MPSISGPSMILRGRPSFWRASSVSVFDVVDDAVDERVREPLFDGAGPPGFVFFDRLGLGRDRFGKGDEPFGGIGAAVEEDVFDVLEQRFVDLFVDGELAGVDDPHVEAGVDGVVQEGRVHRLADRLVAAEGERHVAHAAGDLRAGTGLLDLPHASMKSMA